MDAGELASNCWIKTAGLLNKYSRSDNPHMTVKRWIVREHDAQQVDALAGVLNVSPTIAALLISRGCADEITARKFLRPAHDQLHDPVPDEGY